MIVGLGLFYEICLKGLSLDSLFLLNCRFFLYLLFFLFFLFSWFFFLLIVELIKRIRIYIKNLFKFFEENEKGNF